MHNVSIYSSPAGDGTLSANNSVNLFTTANDTKFTDHSRSAKKLNTPTIDMFISRNIVGAPKDFKKCLYEQSLKDEIEEKDQIF